MLPSFEAVREGYLEKNKEVVQEKDHFGEKEKVYEYTSLDYVVDINEENMIVVAGSDGYNSFLKVVTQNDKYESNLLIDEGKYSQVVFVRSPKTKMAGIITGNDKGALSIF
mmetsp:Transcript_2939/g.2773  ORF Transcript_2939/g.2773 Transcript_2939/m.2773 type:complete len:111 (+) Transcript_2939:1177-1509(+)